jgi:RND family efflux transporter MFP subunit
MTELRSPVSLILGVALGIGACALVVWNPFGWTQIDHVIGRSLPISGMDPSSVRAATPETASNERPVLYWRAPMDPSYTSDEPGKSPMGMDLVPVYEDETSTDGGVRVSPSFLQNFAVRTTEVVRVSLPHEIRTVGVLSHNEENVFSINTKFDGWIEKARVNNVGERVAVGDVLFDIYSPQLVTTQQEYLAAMDYVQRLTNNEAYPEAIERATSLLESARTRLQYWDISQEQIDALEQSKTASRTIQFISPYSGFIVEKRGDSLEGMKLSPGMSVLKLADHSTLWAGVEFYEDDIRHLRVGQHVTVEVDAFPGRRWSGRILLFRPAVNPRTRTLTAFVEVTNPDLRLLPQMYVNVSSRAGGVANALVVPAQAVLHSGDRSVVIVAKDGGRFEPREVRLGMASEGMQQVTDGLSPGDQVVTSSQFLIDSESNLRAAISQLLDDNPEEDDAMAPMTMDHQH